MRARISSFSVQCSVERVPECFGPFTKESRVARKHLGLLLGEWLLKPERPKCQKFSGPVNQLFSQTVFVLLLAQHVMSIAIFFACESFAAFSSGVRQAIHPASRSSASPSCSLLDDALASAKEQFREVTVQHILVDTQMDANDIYEAIRKEGATPAVVGRFAASQSTCGSAKKSPDAKLGLLRGNPGEIKFRRGSMAKEFEEAAFAAESGTLVAPFATEFGWHVMLVN